MGWRRIISAHALGFLLVGGVYFMWPRAPRVEPLRFDKVERRGAGMVLDFTYLGKRSDRIDPRAGSTYNRIYIYDCDNPSDAWNGATYDADISLLNRASKAPPSPYGARLSVKDVSCLREMRYWHGDKDGYVTSPAADWNKICLSYRVWRYDLLRPTLVRATTGPGDLVSVGALCEVTEPVDPTKNVPASAGVPGPAG